MDDTQLLREYAEKKSERAFARLVELHVDLVYSAALRRVGGDHHRAEEVVQMVFTDLARKAERLKDHPFLSGWLHRSTRWAAATLRRTEQRRTTNEHAAATDATLVASTEPTIDWEKLSPVLDCALDALNERDRDIVLLRYFKNNAFAEIGASLGLSENTSRMRVDRALAKLQAILRKNGITSSSAALGLVLTQKAVCAAPHGTAAAVSTTSLSTAAASGGSLLAYFLMTKLQIALAGAAVIALSVVLTLQTLENSHLQRELTSLQSRLESTHASAASIRGNVAQLENKLKQLEEAIAAQPPPLTAEQQERLRLDMIVRKGELDMEYASLFRQLKLSPEPLDKLKILIVERNQAVYDATKLAQSQGLEPTSLSESRKISESATSEIDNRVALLLGTAGYAKFREYIDLKPYRMEAMSLLYLEQNPNPTSYSEILATTQYDDRINHFTQFLAKEGAEFLDAQYRANGWPVDPPAEFIAALAKTISPEALQRYKDNYALNTDRRRMWEIARDAALQGKLKLSKGSARDYPAPNQNQPSAAK